MNRFRFRLQNVLRLREIEEDKKKREFGEVMRDLNHEQQELGRLDNSLHKHEQFMAEYGMGRISARQLDNNHNYARALDGRILSQKKRVKDKQQNVDGKRSELAESTKRKRVLERLKERYREEHDHKVAREEQATIDDITSVRYAWSPRENKKLYR
jgi:flagellar FliJ protein